MDINLATLGEICDRYGGIIRTGPFGSQLHQSDYKPEGTPVIMPKDIINGKIQSDNIARIGPNDAKRLSQHSLKKGDIIYGRRGDIGRRAIITEKEVGWICGTGCLRISLNPKIIEPLYLYYYLGQKDVSDWIFNQAIGATLPNLNTQIIRSVKINCLPFQTQQKIAAILSAYDDLIDNNNKRIAVLEKMSEEIYREWFVRLRFPGYEKVKYVKGIPERWEIKSVSQVYRTSSGGTPSRKNPGFFKGEYNWVKTGELLDSYIFDTEEKITAQAIENSSAKIFPENTVIMAMYGGMSDESKKSTLGQLGILTKPSTTNQACCGFFPKEQYISEFFTFYLLKSYRNEFINISFGAAQQNISQTVINNFKIIVPYKDLISIFSKVVEPFFREIKTVIKVNQKFIKIRGLLLPRLLSGQLNVNDLDICFPKSMEDDYAELHP